MSGSGPGTRVTASSTQGVKNSPGKRERESTGRGVVGRATGKSMMVETHSYFHRQKESKINSIRNEVALATSNVTSAISMAREGRLEGSRRMKVEPEVSMSSDWD